MTATTAAASKTTTTSATTSEGNNNDDDIEEERRVDSDNSTSTAVPADGDDVDVDIDEERRFDYFADFRNGGGGGDDHSALRRHRHRHPHSHREQHRQQQRLLQLQQLKDGGGEDGVRRQRQLPLGDSSFSLSLLDRAQALRSTLCFLASVNADAVRVVEPFLTEYPRSCLLLLLANTTTKTTTKAAGGGDDDDDHDALWSGMKEYDYGGDETETTSPLRILKEQSLTCRCNYGVGDDIDGDDTATTGDDDEYDGDDDREGDDRADGDNSSHRRRHCRNHNNPTATTSPCNQNRQAIASLILQRGGGFEYYHRLRLDNNGNRSSPSPRTAPSSSVPSVVVRQFWSKFGDDMVSLEREIRRLGNEEFDLQVRVAECAVDVRNYQLRLERVREELVRSLEEEGGGGGGGGRRHSNNNSNNGGGGPLLSSALSLLACSLNKKNRGNGGRCPDDGVVGSAGSVSAAATATELFARQSVLEYQVGVAAANLVSAERSHRDVVLRIRRARRVQFALLRKAFEGTPRYVCRPLGST